MSDIEVVREYIDDRVEFLKSSADFWKAKGREDKYKEKMARIRELVMIENVLDEMEL